MNLPLPIKNIRKIQTCTGLRKRGSTVLLVLAMLTILLLLGIAFSYSTRLETQASNNYAELAQARTSAATGLPLAIPFIIEAAQGLTANSQTWNTVPQTLQKMVKNNGKSSQLTASELAAIRKAGVDASRNREGQLEEAPQANIVVRDMSGLVNINAVPNQTAMERVISAVLPGSDVKAKSTALMALRGDLKSPAQQRHSFENYKREQTEEDENIDLRDPDSEALDTLLRLKYDRQNGRGIFTDKEIDKLAEFVTVYSQAPEVFNGPNGIHIPRIPLDGIDTKEVYEKLTAAFPDKKPELLLQYTANLVDFSDDNSEPTILDSEGNVVVQQEGSVGNDAQHLTIGVEMTPFISEVYPDAATSVGFDDDGQFVEIVNPWNKSMSLAGYTLRTQQGATIALNATLPAGGYLVITDNYNSPKPETPPGHGSLVSLFGATSNGSTKQVQMEASLNLTDRNSKVTLHDQSGRLVDFFAYGSTGQVDGKTSFQRNDPMVRGASKAEATPFGAAVASGANAEVISAATKAWEDGNSTMTKISQLFTISTGFAEKNAGGDGNTVGSVHGGQLAELTFPEQTNANGAASDPYSDNLDLRLIDLFTVSSLDIPIVDEEEDESADSNNGGDAYRAFREKMKRLNERRRDGEKEETTVTTAFSYGKVNVNTCSKYALLGLDLQAVNGADGSAGLIEKFEGYRLGKGRQDSAPFLNVSDFVTKMGTNISRSNLTALDKITDQISVGSSAFEIVSTNRLSAEQQAALEGNDNASGSRPATATARWVISLDQQPYSIVDFSLIP